MIVDDLATARSRDGLVSIDPHSARVHLACLDKSALQDAQAVFGQ
jgi:hypothetical protein